MTRPIVTHEDTRPELGLCECGCGERTRISGRTRPSENQVKGRPMRFVARHTPPTIQRFFDKIVALDDEDGGCWLWLAAKDSKGYGTFYADERTKVAHRWSYEHFVGEIPVGLEIDHLCRVRGCVNPDHLEAVTHAENVRRGESVATANARKTHCPQGHPYTPGNTRITREGFRRCRTCKRLEWTRRAA